MGLIKRIGSLPILPKLALTFLMVLTPLFYIGLKMGESGSNIVRAEIANSLASRTELYMDLLDSDFDRTIRLLGEYMYDEDLMKLSTSSEVMPIIERTYSVLRLKNRMDQLNRTSSFVENAMAFIPDMNRVVSSKENSISELDNELFQALSQPQKNVAEPFLVWNGRIFISMPYPGGNELPMFLLAVEISSTQLSSKLKQFTQEASLAALVSNNMEWAVSGEFDRVLGSELPDRLDTVKVDGTEIITLDHVDYLLASKESDILNAKLMMFVPVKQVEKPLERYRNWVFALYGVSVLVIIAFAFGMYRIIHRPLKLLVRSFRRIEQGKFDISIEYPFTDEFGYLYKQLNAMVRELKRLIHEVYEQEYRARVAELRHLQSQINPHFLYNTFFILYRLAKQEENESIARLTNHLGEYFEFITRDGSQEVTLASEVAHAKSYTDIQTIRFSNRIEVRFSEVPKGAEGILVPRLILQPIIENAYEHALEKKAKGGLLEVDIQMTSSELLIRVEDSGGIAEDTLNHLQIMLNSQQDVAESTGLINVHRRLLINYGDKAGLRLSRGDLCGLKVIMVIPLKEEVPSASITNR
ncbi:sensor histidine kinase [Paenibacillus sp. LPE1-1-1.1]|uniref:sensor histidine kinase n=1 Tax=Paenibacillus sp. LPE1-1-1.1 TaxID=3135230 RepID=UPI00341FA153